MLLCIALVAALGVQAFALELSNRETAETYEAKAAALKAEKAGHLKYADTLVEIEELYKDYYAEHGALKAAKADAKEFAKLDAKYKELIENKANSDALLKTWTDSSKDGANPVSHAPNVFVPFDGTHFMYEYAAWDKIIEDANSYWDAKYDTKIADAEFQAELYNDKADEEDAAAKAAAAAEKLEAAALKAAKAAVSDPKTSADWLLYWAAYNQVKENAKLSTAKTAAETAKKSIAVAQKGAVAAAKAAVTEAQVVAYNNMQSEITKAVNEYVTGVNAAIAEYIAGLAE